MSVLVAVPGQLCIYFLAMLLVAHGWFQVGIAWCDVCGTCMGVQAAMVAVLLTALCTALYFMWFRRLSNPFFATPDESGPPPEVDLDTTPLLQPASD